LCCSREYLKGNNLDSNVAVQNFYQTCNASPRVWDLKKKVQCSI
jgi:hypothetical protein